MDRQQHPPTTKGGRSPHALPALWLSFAFFLSCSFAGGVAHGLKNVMFRSLIHLQVSDHLHGRACAGRRAELGEGDGSAPSEPPVPVAGEGNPPS